jgi:hypothetical protein
MGMNAASLPPGSRNAAIETALRQAIPAFALTLILYLPIEAALLVALPPAPYWFLRLLPDALIVVAALAVIVVGDPRASTTPIRILWAVGAVALLIVIANTARGIPVADSINAVRVLTRYLVLGLIMWWAVDGRDRLGTVVIGAILLSGAIQVGIATIELVTRVPVAAESGVAGWFFLEGSFGRYDRFGLFMMSVIVAVVATADRRTPWRFALLAACALFLYLSTSRQAVVGLGVACAILMVWPRVPLERRAIAAGTGVLALVLLLTSPSGLQPPLDVSEPDAPATSGHGVSRPIKDSIVLSTNPNLNFRLFYNLQLAPWAALTEPVVGFGPRQQVALAPDPRLIARVESAGMDWAWARNFTNDSNYASMIIQFGVIVPALFLLLLLWTMFSVARAEWVRRDPTARFAVAFAGATIVAAWFGPAFEIRTVSLTLWIGLMAAMAARRLVAEPDGSTAPRATTTATRPPDAGTTVEGARA